MNFFKYFDQLSASKMFSREALAPDGQLIMDPAEHLGRAEHLFALAAEGIYTRRPNERVARASGTLARAAGK